MLLENKYFSRQRSLIRRRFHLLLVGRPTSFLHLLLLLHLLFHLLVLLHLLLLLHLLVLLHLLLLFHLLRCLER